jgi:hypothetical protein
MASSATVSRASPAARMRQRLWRTRPDDQAPLRLRHERIYILPTRRGLALLGTVLTMLLTSLNYALSLGFGVTFVLSEQDGTSATYEALCPRCGSGKIVVSVALDPDGSFAAEPACPALCVDCEDRLDAILEPEAAKPIADEPGNRATLAKYLKAMTQRSWDR